jgi:PqqD family protein of HPr-rel-A system
MAPLKPKVREDLAVEELDGEAVVFDERSGELHYLNPTATIVFKLFDGSATVKELSADIATAFRAQQADVERHVRALMREFRKKGLLAELPGRSHG